MAILAEPRSCGLSKHCYVTTACFDNLCDFEVLQVIEHLNELVLHQHYYWQLFQCPVLCSLQNSVIQLRWVYLSVCFHGVLEDLELVSLLQCNLLDVLWTQGWWHELMTGLVLNPACCQQELLLLSFELPKLFWVSSRINPKLLNFWGCGLLVWILSVQLHTSKYVLDDIVVVCSTLVNWSLLLTFWRCRVWQILFAVSSHLLTNCLCCAVSFAEKVGNVFVLWSVTTPCRRSLYLATITLW